MSVTLNWLTERCTISAHICCDGILMRSRFAVFRGLSSTSAMLQLAVAVTLVAIYVTSMVA